MRARRLSRPAALLAVLAAAGALCGCGAGGEAPESASPLEQAHEFAEQLSQEDGESQLRERRAEYEEAQQEREEDPEAEEQAQAEGAQARDAIAAHEQEQEEAEEEPARTEHEPRPGRVLRGG